MQSGLEFRDVVHEGTREWNEWLATGVLPDGVATVVMKEGDPAWERLRDDAGFTARYDRVFTTGSIFRRDGPLRTRSLALAVPNAPPDYPRISRAYCRAGGDGRDNNYEFPSGDRRGV
jgi:hypothetical protein